MSPKTPTKATAKTPASTPAKSPAKTPSAIERWAPEAQKAPDGELRLSVPLHVLLGEAVDVARFFEKYFPSQEGTDGRTARPGLDTVADERRHLTASTGQDILSLCEAVQSSQTAYLLTLSPQGAAPMERGRFVVDEMSSTLEWLFDDGVEDTRDAQLASVVAEHETDPDSADALASELEDYAALAGAHRKAMDGLGGFDPALIDEAKTLAAELRARPATPIVLSDESRNAKSLRDRLATVMLGRMNVVRSAARFVYRQWPEIVREVTSAYERRRRAAARRAGAKKAPGNPE